MKRFIQGSDRSQGILLPAELDDYVTEENPVRVIDIFVDELNLVRLGFEGVRPADTGRPAYHPADLLKLYIYGYLNRIQSSRRLEREAQRNIELMWLTGRLAPDFKTIANFRRDNGVGIRNVCRQFVLLCRNLDLFTQQLIAIDGSKFKAVNSRDRNFTKAKVRARLQQIEESIERYLSMLDTIDRTEPAEAPAKTVRLQDKIILLKEQMQALKEVEGRLPDAPDEQISLTDPDARSMASSGRGTGMVGYNVQTAVDTTHHLIVAHEVTNIGNDRGQLANMAQQAREATGIEKLAVVADRGYFSGEEVLACDQAGITTYVPKPLTSGAKADGRFGKQDFVYMPDRDEYRCPAGHAMTRRFETVDKGLIINVYATPECRRCLLKPDCTTGPERRIRRWENEAVIDAMQERLSKAPEQMRWRRQTARGWFHFDVHSLILPKAWRGTNARITLYRRVME
ncbi:MAG: transposase [Herminiimonas sp.]|nr:transposase [Herminiimonas sp.]